MRLLSRGPGGLAVLAGAVALAVAAGPASADPFKAPLVVYREVFPNDSITPGTTGAQRLEMQAQGWFGRQHGNPPFTPTTAASPNRSGQISIPGSGVTPEVAPINSNPVGPIATTGFLFWSPTDRAGIYLYTNEFPGLQTQDLVSVNFDSRNNGNTDDSASRMRLALLVNGTDWYISDQGVSHTTGPNAWQNQTLTLAGLTFGLFDDLNAGEPAGALPRNNPPASSGLLLPPGTVTAFGLYVGFNQSAEGSATIRIDNFEITALVPVPEPTSLALLGCGLAVSLGAAWKRRRARTR